MTARGQTPSALLFGEALVGYGSVEPTLRTAPQFTRFPEGADLNVAVGLARLGVRATWASVLGDDAHGDYLADAVAQLGITPLAPPRPGPTALMFRWPAAAPRPSRRRRCPCHHPPGRPHRDA